MMERLSRVGAASEKIRCLKLLRQRLTARDFDRKVAERQVCIAVLNGYAALGMPATKVVG